jgi:hypothetical protein
MSILIKGLGHEKHILCLASTFDETDLFDHIKPNKLMKMAMAP